MRNKLSNESLSGLVVELMEQKNNSVAHKTELIAFSSLIIWSCLYILLSAFALVGNVSIITIFTKRKRLRTRMNYYIMGLAFSDLLIAVVIIPLWLSVVWLQYLMQKSQQTVLITKIFGPLDILCGMLSILHLMVISLERLHAISLPLSHRSLRPAASLHVILVVWIVSAVIAVTAVFLPKGFQWKGTFIIYTCIGFFVPFTVIFISYLSITILVKNRDEQLRSRHTELSLHQERKLALTSFLIILLFVVTWLPFFSVNLIFYVCSGCVATISYHVILAVKALHYTGSALNVIVYASRESEFRRPMIMLLTRRREKTINRYVSMKYKETEV